MSSPNSTYSSDVLSTSMQMLEGKPFDNITENKALTYHLKKRGRVKAIDGGPSIVVPLSYQENANYSRYSGGEQLAIASVPVFTAAQYPWKQAAITVQINGLEEIQNAGRSQVADLLEARLENAMVTATNNFDADCWSAGTSSDGKQIGGMQLLFGDTATNTFGGISQTTWSFWQHTVKGGVADYGAAVASSNILTYFSNILNAIENRDYPVTIIFADNTYFGYFESATIAIQRIAKEGEMARVGFRSYAYRNDIEVVLAGGLGSSAPSAHAFFVAGDTVELRYYKGRNWTRLTGDRRPVNQDSKVEILAWAGNLICRGPRYNAVLKA